MEIVYLLLVGLVAGWLAGVLVAGGGFGIIGDIVVGILGSLLGGFAFNSLGVYPGGGLFGILLVATIGAASLIFLLRLFKPVRVT